MRVFAAQFEPVELDTEANLDQARAVLRRAALAGADLAVLPETWSTGYNLVAARELRDRSAALIAPLADEARRRSVAVVGSMVLPTDTGAANVAVLIDRDGAKILRCAKGAVEVDLGELRALREDFPMLRDRWIGLAPGLRS